MRSICVAEQIWYGDFGPREAIVTSSELRADVPVSADLNEAPRRRGSELVRRDRRLGGLFGTRAMQRHGTCGAAESMRYAAAAVPLKYCNSA